jgi:hypothetical protein
VQTWLSQPERPEPYLQNVLYTKVVLALMTKRSAEEILNVQRREHLRMMRELTTRKTGGDLSDHLICDFALFHLEADLRWLELTAARLDELKDRLQWAAGRLHVREPLPFITPAIFLSDPGLRSELSSSRCCRPRPYR